MINIIIIVVIIERFRAPQASSRPGSSRSTTSSRRARLYIYIYILHIYIYIYICVCIHIYIYIHTHNIMHCITYIIWYHIIAISYTNFSTCRRSGGDLAHAHRARAFTAPTTYDGSRHERYRRHRAIMR